MASRTKKPRARETGQSSNPQQEYPTSKFLSLAHEKAFPAMLSRSIISGRRVNLAPKYDALLVNKLAAMGWQNLVNLPHKVYPRLVSLFYLHFKHTNEEEKDYTVISYVKGKHIEFNIPTLAQILGVKQSENKIYFQTEAQMAQVVGDISKVYSTICIDKVTGSNLHAKHLKPHLRILHRFLLENVTPKAGHYDAVPTFNAYLLYCFEVERSVDLSFIIMREMDLVSITRGKSLAFGALLTNILKHFKIKFLGEAESKIDSDISEYTLNRAGGGDILLNSLNAPDAPMEDPKEHHQDAMPPPQPPAFWTDFMAMEQERYNQRLQWEQQMATQMAEFGNAQNSLIQLFGDFWVDNNNQHQELNTRIDHIEHRVDAIYQYYFPPPPPDSK